MKKIKLTKGDIIRLIISTLITATITGFSSKLIEKYINDSGLSIPKIAFHAFILIIIILAITTIIFFILKGIEFCCNSFCNKRSRKSVENRFEHELNNFVTQIAEIKEKHYQNNQLKKHEALNVLAMIKPIPEFLYDVIPQKIDNPNWDKKTSDMLYNLNREEIKTLIKDCLDILNDIYKINSTLKNDSVLEEQFRHLLDEMATYAN